MPAINGYSQTAPINESSNFINYFDRIQIKLNVSSQTDVYTLRQKMDNDFKINANNEFKTFLSLDYQFIGFSYGFSPKFLNANNDDYQKGHTSFTDYKFYLFPGQWLQTLSFDKTKGYYIENSNDFIPGWQKDKDPYLQIPSLKNTQWAGSTSFVVNKNFSFKNLIYQTQWQKKSSGSFVPTVSYDYNRYSFDFDGTQALQKDFNLRLGLGYYYTFVIANKFFIAPNLVPAIGGRYSKEKITANGITTVEARTYFTRFLDGGLKCGFNSNKWVAGAGITFNVNWYNENTNELVENDKLYGIVYIGYRFSTPRFINKTYDDLSKKIP
jgi:hypothetical protein